MSKFSTMFKFFYKLKYNTHPERIKGKSEELVGFASRQAFSMFRNVEFRDSLDFAHSEKVEQDRFFNEMVVTNIVMVMLLLDQEVAASDPGERRDYLKEVREEMPRYYIRYLKKIGVEDKFAHIWKKLLDLRYNEYTEDTPEWRQAFMAVDRGLASDNHVAIFQTLAFGLYRHLRRGKVEKEDPLFKKIQGFQVFTFKETRKRIG